MRLGTISSERQVHPLILVYPGARSRDACIPYSYTCGRVFDVQDQTASAKLTASWGTDYLLLAKVGDRWMITHVLWQSPPSGRP